MTERRGIEDMEAVTTVDLLAYRQSIEHLAASSQNRYLAAIKSFFAWAHESGIIERNPAAGLKLPRAIQGKAPTYITLSETETLLQSIKPGRYAKCDLVML